MSLPNIDEVRRRIKRVKREDIRFCLMSTYLFAARISEVVGYSSPSDKTSGRGPRGTDVQIELFQMGEINEKAAVFTLRTAKRGGKIRLVALPMNPIYESWTRPLYRYFRKHRSKLVFPFTRQLVWQYVKKHRIFDGLLYPVDQYAVWKDKKKIYDVNEHLRPFALHALRHLRATELVQFYGFDGRDLAVYGGWTFRSMGFPSTADRYLSLGWQSYFPKLLKGRNR